MTREEMLRKLDVSFEELQDLASKHSAFMASLNARQQAVVQASMPSLSQAVTTFGAGVTEHDLQQLLDDSKLSDTFAAINVACPRCP